MCAAFLKSSTAAAPFCTHGPLPEFKNAGGPAACGTGLPRRGYRRACGDWRRLVPRLQDMAAQSIPCIGIPGTIDNDIACSDYTYRL